jgi:hypothetical protein
VKVKVVEIHTKSLDWKRVVTVSIIIGTEHDCLERCREETARKSADGKVVKIGLERGVYISEH